MSGQNVSPFRKYRSNIKRERRKCRDPSHKIHSQHESDAKILRQLSESLSPHKTPLRNRRDITSGLQDLTVLDGNENPTEEERMEKKKTEITEKVGAEESSSSILASHVVSPPAIKRRGSFGVSSVVSSLSADESHFDLETEFELPPALSMDLPVLSSEDSDVCSASGSDDDSSFEESASAIQPTSTSTPPSHHRKVSLDNFILHEAHAGTPIMMPPKDDKTVFNTPTHPARPGLGGRTLSAHAPLRERLVGPGLGPRSRSSILHSSPAFPKPSVSHARALPNVVSTSWSVSSSGTVSGKASSTTRARSPLPPSMRSVTSNSHRSATSMVSILSHDIPSDSIVINGQLVVGSSYRNAHQACPFSREPVPSPELLSGKKQHKRNLSSVSGMSMCGSESESSFAVRRATNTFLLEEGSGSVCQASAERELRRKNVVVEEIKFKVGRLVPRPASFRRNSNSHGVNDPKKVQLVRAHGCLT